MHRKLGSVIVLGAVALSLTGCLKVDMGITINPDGQTGEFTVTESFDKKALESLGSMGGNPSEGGICDLVRTGMNEDEKETGKWTETEDACLFTSDPITFKYDEKGLKSLDGNSSLISDSHIEIQRSQGEVKVSIDFTYINDVEGPSETGAGLGSLISDFDVSITFPGKATFVSEGGKISNDGKTASWTKDQVFKSMDGSAKLEARGSLSSFDLLPLIIAGAIFLLVAGGVIVGIILFRKRSAKGKAAVAATEQPAPAVEGTEEQAPAAEASAES